MSQPGNTHQFVRSAQSGDMNSWGVLYNKYYAFLYAIAIQRSHNTSLAQDIIQETFIIAYLKLGQLKETAAFSGWLKKILLHLCQKANRLNHNQPLYMDSGKISPWWEDDINRELDQRYNENALYSGLVRLPDLLRTTLMLRYFSSHNSYEEISQILGVPVGTVRSRLNQAKLKLSETWKQQVEPDARVLDQNESWNHFYESTLSGIHYHDQNKDRFLSHLNKDVEMISPGGSRTGTRTIFENMIRDDQHAGSWLSPVNIFTSGNLTIIESEHYNSPEHPYHCPPRSIMLIYRDRQKVKSLQLHISK